MSPRSPSRCSTETGRIDFVVNTAGVLVRGELAETSEETIYSSTDINYLAPIFVAQEFFPHLAASCGSLLLFTSSSYTRGRSGYSLYSSAKAAIVNLTQALADEWASSGVRVNCVNPERTGTPMRTKAFGEEPPGTLLSSEEVARQSLDVLLSHLTGHIIDIRREEGPRPRQRLSEFNATSRGPRAPPSAPRPRHAPEPVEGQLRASTSSGSKTTSLITRLWSEGRLESTRFMTFSYLSAACCP